MINRRQRLMRAIRAAAGAMLLLFNGPAARRSQPAIRRRSVQFAQSPELLDSKPSHGVLDHRSGRERGLDYHNENVVASASIRSEIDVLISAPAASRSRSTGTQCSVINFRQSAVWAGEEKPFSVRALTFSCALSGVLAVRSLSEMPHTFDKSIS
jgi:hypothetical protein